MISIKLELATRLLVVMSDAAQELPTEQRQILTKARNDLWGAVKDDLGKEEK